jgi:hypothetical protein
LAHRPRAEIFWPIVVLGGWTALVISQGATTEFIHFEI